MDQNTYCSMEKIKVLELCYTIIMRLYYKRHDFKNIKKFIR